MQKIIHTPSEIIKGRIYISADPDITDEIIYLGFRDGDANKMGLVIVSTPYVSRYSIGGVVTRDPDAAIWGKGFVEKEFVWE